MRNLPWLAWLFFIAPPAADHSLLSTALAVAERVSVPHMRAEENLTWKSSQLEQLARLYAKAGRFDQAQSLVTELDEEERTKCAALGAIAVAAIEAGDLARAEDLAQKLLASDEWTAPLAVAAIARAYQAAGKSETALRLARQVRDAAERSNLLLEIGGPAELKEALLAAEEVSPGRVHVPVGDQLRWLYDYSNRYEYLLAIVHAAVERGQLDLAREALAAIDKVPGSGSFQWRARALLEIDRGERAAGGPAQPDAATWKRALAEVEAGQPENMGDLTAKVDLMAGLAGRLSPEEAGKLLARAAELAKGAEEMPADNGGASILSEMLTRLARAHGELGHRAEARGLLERVVHIAETMPISKAVKGSSVDFPASSRQDRVTILAEAAAGFELLGDDSRADEVLAKALAEIAAIDNEEWRQYSWRAIVETYDAVGKLDRALDIVGSGRASGDLDKLYALRELADRLPAADFSRLAPLVSTLPASYAKTSYSAQLAARYEKDGEPANATRMIDQALAAVAAKPESWDEALLELALADPQAARPADLERRKVLRAILSLAR